MSTAARASLQQGHHLYLGPSLYQEAQPEMDGDRLLPEHARQRLGYQIRKFHDLRRLLSQAYRNDPENFFHGEDFWLA
jgi:hypothetical protein